MGEPGVIQCEQMVKNTSAFPEIDYDKTMVCRQFKDMICYVCMWVCACVLCTK